MGLLGGDWGDKFLRAAAIRNKDYGAAARISGDIRERKQDKLDAEQAKELEAELTSLLEDEFMTQGYDREDARRQARLALLNAKDVGSSISSRLDTRTMGPGQTLAFGRNRQFTTPTGFEQEANFAAKATPEQMLGMDRSRPIINNGPYGQQFIPRTSIPSGAAGGTPKPGTVEDGFIFKGGDPSDPNNWQPVDNVAGQNIPIPRLGGR